MQMLVTPGKQDLQDGMEVRQGGLAGHQHAPPDERADAAQDDSQLIDAEWCSSGSYALRVAQRIVSLKGSPRYLTLSYVEASAAGHAYAIIRFATMRCSGYNPIKWSDVMASLTLEERVAALEETVAKLFAQSASAVGKKDWRSTLGMFADNTVMQEIDEEGRRIREADRRQAQSCSS